MKWKIWTQNLYKGMPHKEEGEDKVDAPASLEGSKISFKTAEVEGETGDRLTGLRRNYPCQNIDLNLPF